ncbi:MAG: hypothetical protein V7733_10680 [Paraglaciecola polaris]|uniref:hypothetical protein n=1 Tax=Paraglaciecola polaris TaxID=222814 RepID=UPI0030030157
MLIWSLSRHNKIMVLRFDVFPANLELDVTAFNKVFIRRVRSIYGSDTKMLWVREKGKYKDKNNSGIHYHYILTMVKNTERSIPEIGTAINELSKYFLRRQLYLSEEYKFPSDLEVESSIIKNEPITSPYSTFRGFFGLDRRYLAPDKARSQKTQIQFAIDEERGFRYLDVSKIVNRNYNKGIALGGVLEECIYALSYLAKLKTKEDLPKSERIYTPPRYAENNLVKGRLEEIKKFENQVKEAFALYK